MTDGVKEVIITPTKDKNGVKKSNDKLAKKIPSKPAKIDVANGTKKMLINAEADSKLNKLLNEIKDEGKNGVSKVAKTVETSTSSDDLPQQKEDKKETAEMDSDKEAERIAIEKIDVVVKDAEERAEEIAKSNQEENGTVTKAESDEETLPSTCPLSLQ